jgi:hypothetical protein
MNLSDLLSAHVNTDEQRKITHTNSARIINSLKKLCTIQHHNRRSASRIILINLWAERHGNDERHFEVMAVDLVCALNVDTNVGFTAVSEKI